MNAETEHGHEPGVGALLRASRLRCGEELRDVATLLRIRYPFLDWARIIGIFCVFLYHSGRAFDFEDWHVKNPVPSEGITIWLGFLILWIMPLMFVVSGVSSYLSLRSRTAGRFLRDRVLRLLVPLVAMGMLIFGPYQIYLERLTHGQFSGSLLAFLPHYFEGWYYPGQPGNFAWMGVHLWYLLVLFLWSLLLLPLFVWLKRESAREWLTNESPRNTPDDRVASATEKRRSR